MQQRADTIAELVAASADVALALRDERAWPAKRSALSSSDTVTQARLLQPDDTVLVTSHAEAAGDGRRASRWYRRR